MSPSTFRRVLIDQGLSLPEPQPRSRSAKKPWPDWLEWKPNRIWIWDATHFHAIPRVCFAIVDMVSASGSTPWSAWEETATQVQVMFEHALEVEGLLELLTDERLDLDTDDPRRPILLAVSDNGPPMTARDTRAFMALMAIAQHHGCPHTPQDQAGSRPSSATSRGEWPHLETITDPALLDAELARVRTEYTGSFARGDRLRHPRRRTRRPRPSHQAGPPRRSRPRPPATPGLPSQQQNQTRREDAMNWVISHAISAVKSDTPQS